MSDQFNTFLSKVPFLKEASKQDLQQLGESCIVRQHPQAAVIVSQASFGHSMFILLSGQVSLHSARENGSQIAVGRLVTPGAFFGEEALLGRGIRLTTAIAETDVVLLEMEQRKFALLARRTEGANAALEHSYHQRAITNFIRMHPHLCKLDPKLEALIIAGATMKTLEKDQFAWRQNTPATHVMLVADGVLKAIRTSGSQLSVLAYFNTGDIVGAHDIRTHRYDLKTLGKAEVILIEQKAFRSLKQSAPDIYAHFHEVGPSKRGFLDGASKTFYGSVEALLHDGMEVESLLIIDLDRCVRCGNCVRACHSRHEFTRLNRRGPIIKRRKIIASNEHEHLLIPSSCRHCRDPACMIGCPTGAIRRNPNGEVEINEDCIGCDNCARKCPYGNISMRPVPPSKQTGNVTKKAIKCDLCKGYEYSNCVHECPRGALLRVNPMEHFDELALVLGADQGLADELLSKKRRAPAQSYRRPMPVILVFLGLLFGPVVISTAYSMAPSHSAASPTGLTFGIISAACIFLALLLGARKKFNNHGLGRAETWTLLHIVIGALGLLTALAHANFTITGVSTTLLMLLFLFEFGTGVLGQLLYSYVPKILTHIEKHGDAKLVEDLHEERRLLREGLDEFLRKQPKNVRNYARKLKRLAGSPAKRLSKRFDSKEHVAMLQAKYVVPLELIEFKPTLDRVLLDYCNLATVTAQIRLHHLLKQWLVVHLATAAALTVFLVLHIVTMLPILW